MSYMSLFQKYSKKISATNHALERREMNAKLNWLTRQIGQSPHTKITGYLGEMVILEALRGNDKYRGLLAKSNKTGDMHVVNKDTGEYFKVEIKTAKRGKQGYQFCLRKNDRHGQTNISHADIVILLCVGLSGAFWPFVVPKEVFGRQKKAHIRNIETTKYSEYRQTLKTLEFEL